MAVTNQLNPEVVKTELDDVFFQEFNLEGKPGFATVTTPQIFKQVALDNAAHIEAVLSGAGGYWDEKGEEGDVALASPEVTNKVTYTADTLAKGIQLSREFFDDNMHSTWSKMVRAHARNARRTRERVGFGLYRDGFTTTLTADGVSFFNTAHTLIDGGTQSNRVASNPVLTTTALNTAMVQMQEMKSQDGVVMGSMPSCLLVPPALRKLALEIVNSTLASGTADNDLNVYSSSYAIDVLCNNHLGAAASGSDTAWFLLSEDHDVTRYSREDINTTLVDWRYSGNDNYVYKGRYREVYGVTDYIGAVGSDGSGS